VGKHAKASPQLKRKLMEQIAAEREAKAKVVSLDEWKRRSDLRARVMGRVG
jgi:hypothetical protein